MGRLAEVKAATHRMVNASTAWPAPRANPVQRARAFYLADALSCRLGQASFLPLLFSW